MPSPHLIRRFHFYVPVLLCLTLLVPPGILPGFWDVVFAVLQGLVAFSGLILVFLASRPGNPGDVRKAGITSGQLIVLAAAGMLVGGVYPHWPLVPLVFLLIFPLLVFARMRWLFWVPAAVLFIVAAGRHLFIGDPGLYHWSAAFLVFSAVVGWMMARDREAIMRSRAQLERIQRDARETMSRVRRDGVAETGERIRGEQAARAVTLEEDDLFTELLKWGCRFFGARTGILLVPHESGAYRVRAGVKRGVEVVGEMIPAEKGFVHLARERGGVLYLSDARSAAPALGLYPEGTVVGSLLVKVVYDAQWGRDVAGGERAGKISCVLYFDSARTDAFSGDDRTFRLLEEFGLLVGKTMGISRTLQRIMEDISGKYAINRYARDLTMFLDPEKIIRKALEAAMEAIPECDGATVLLSTGDGLTMGQTGGESVKDLAFKKITREEPSQIGLLLRRFAGAEGGVGDESVRSGIVINKEKSKSSPFFVRGEKLGKVVSFAAIPSFIPGDGGRMILKAVITAVSRKKEIFCQEEVDDLKTLAGMMAPALDNALTHRRVDELSRTDGLTGLLNLRAFLLVLEGKMTRVRRGYDPSMALVMVDGDHFKRINDTYGHQVGDEVLIELARRLRTPLRKGDAVARYGGEEFTLALDMVDEKETRKIAEKIRKDIEGRPFQTAAGPLDFTASFGFHVMRKGSSLTREELLQRADRALYHAKETGRNKVVGFSQIEMNQSAEDELFLEQAPTLAREEKRW